MVFSEVNVRSDNEWEFGDVGEFSPTLNPFGRIGPFYVLRVPNGSSSFNTIRRCYLCFMLICLSQYIFACGTSRWILTTMTL